MYSVINKTVPFVIHRPHTYTLRNKPTKKMKDLYSKNYALWVFYSEDTCMITM